MDSAHSGGKFHRALGLLDSTAVVVGSMIGSGIFLVSAETARNLGSPLWFLVAWVVSGGLTVLGATCYSELASMYPHAGGQYVFLREAYGKLVGFLYGWTLFMVIQSGTNAAVAVAFAKFLGVFVPAISDRYALFGIGGWSFTTQQVVALAGIVLLTGINCMGISMAKMIQTSFTIIKVIALFLLILIGIFAFSHHQGVEVNISRMWEAVDSHGNVLSGFGLLAAMSLALVGPLFASDAWNNVTFAGEEVKDPQKTLPRSLILGTALVCMLYFLTNVVYLLLLPLFGTEGGATVMARGIQYAAQDRVGTAALEVIFSDAGEKIMAIAIMISTFGALNGLILSGPRLYYAMARDGLFFKQAGILNARTNVPVFGLVIQGIWSCVLATSGTYSQLLEFVIFAALLFYVFTVSAVIVMRRRHPDMERPFKVPLYPILPVIYVVSALVVMAGQIYLHWEYSGAGLLIILSGLPVYLFWRWRGRGLNA
ncbi:MAG TPA: amino acid permease [Candidatus Melainabacteria bacterium]|nr:amino acid permease [Candidatus Melainabacteria bacterium]